MWQWNVNGPESRLCRWDRSGVIVSESRPYANCIDNTRDLLRLLFRYSELTQEERGIDPTAVRLRPHSYGWARMDDLGVAQIHDVDEAERTLPSPDVIPPNFPYPKVTPVRSELFATGALVADPTLECTQNPLPRLRSASMSTFSNAPALPTFKYIRTMFALTSVLC